MEEEKNCKSCGFYIPHYVKSRARLKEVDGHCMNFKYLHRPRDNRKSLEPCRYWKPQENKKDERKKSINETLRNMEKSLEDIKLILQSDED